VVFISDVRAFWRSEVRCTNEKTKRRLIADIFQRNRQTWPTETEDRLTRGRSCNKYPRRGNRNLSS